MVRQYSGMLKKAPYGAFFVFSLLCWGLGGKAYALCDLPAGQAVETVQIDRVYDGDTVRLSDGRRIRLAGINTPEVAHGKKPAEPLAEEATRQLQALLKQQPIGLLVGKGKQDHYGRVLGHLFAASGDNLIAALLQQGAGFQVAIPPNLGFADCYAKAEQEARATGRGVWGNDYYRAQPATAAELRDGYGRISGRVEAVQLTKRAIFVELAGQVTFKIERNVARYIDPDLMDRLVALSHSVTSNPPLWLEAQGWLSDRLTWNGKAPAQVRQGELKRYQMKITHQFSWRVLPTP